MSDLCPATHDDLVLVAATRDGHPQRWWRLCEIVGLSDSGLVRSAVGVLTPGVIATPAGHPRRVLKLDKHGLIRARIQIAILEREDDHWRTISACEDWLRALIETTENSDERSAA